MSVKLYYFDAGGRAEVSRLALHISGVKFDDVRLSFAEFGQKKQAGFFKYGSVPVLEIDGKQIG